MRLRTDLLTEKHGGTNVPSEGEYFIGDVRDLLPDLVKKYAGTVKCVYMDPPFLTGKKFEMRQRVGEAQWKSGRGTLVLNAFSDRQDPAEYWDMIRSVLTASREMLRDDGTIFVHIDYRTHARMRLMMDEIFGEENFLNEIVWSYSTGGRSEKHFSRKHDIILFFSKTKQYAFDAEAVAVPRDTEHTNHMKRHVDPDGRTYRSIRVGGKVYTYYDDEPVPPGDVWTDVSHLQQKDPQRTGYDTQKPLKLLERIIGCSTKPGDLVFDPFSGSGTAADAAAKTGRRFLACDASLPALQTARRRLDGRPCVFHTLPCEAPAECAAACVKEVGLYRVTLQAFRTEGGFDGLDAVDSWAVGYPEDGALRVYDRSVRTWKTPRLNAELTLPVYAKTPVMRVSDVYGRDRYYELAEAEDAVIPE